MYVAIAIGIVIWYFIYGLDCWVNGASEWAHPIWMPFQCLWHDIVLLMPGQKARYIRDNIICPDAAEKPTNGVIMGSRGQSWYYRDVERGNLYHACGKDVLPGISHFVIMHICIPLVPLVAWLCVSCY